MKSKWLLIIALGILFSCNADSSKSVKLGSDGLAKAAVSSKLLIVPGKSVGDISIGENIVVVDSLLGIPDDGDAAMGKAWAIWNENDSTGKKIGEIAVYSSYADSTATSKAVKQIRVTGSAYQTAEQLTTEDLKSNFKAKYPDFKKVATFVNATVGDTISVYDSQSNGIAVEFLRGISRAITVHAKGQPVNTSYLTIKPDLKQVE
jgi:hypothetical protein